MRARRWSRGQVALAWVVSVAFHVAAVILILGGLQVSQRGAGRGERLDTRASAPSDIADDMAFDLASDPPAPQAKPAAAVAKGETPPGPPKKSDGPTQAAVAAPGGNTGEPASAPAKADTPAGPRPAGAGGRALHQSIPTGRSVVYVLDHSSSMGQKGKLAQAADCLRLSLKELKSEVRFQVVHYHSRAEVLTIAGATDLVPATPDNVSAAVNAVQSLVAEGASNHEAGIRKALLLRPDAVFVLTDADDLTAAQLRAVSASNWQRTSIHPVLFGTYRGGNSPFQALARQNRGAPQTVAQAE